VYDRSRVEFGIRRAAAAIAFAAILIGGFETYYLRVFRESPARLRPILTELPYRKMPGLRELLIGTDARTPPGASIAILVPYSAWEGGYGYAYSRSSYLLPGKQVIPLLRLGEDTFDRANLARADYVVCWGGVPAVAGFARVWQTTGGMLVRRSK
jgi:hypothetical protein